MALVKEGCGHPTEWNWRLMMNGKVYTYCMGCIVEKLGLDNLEVYDNPYIKLNKSKQVPSNKASKEKDNPYVDEDIQG